MPGELFEHIFAHIVSLENVNWCVFETLRAVDNAVSSVEVFVVANIGIEQL